MNESSSSSIVNEELFNAIKEGDIEKVKSALESGVSPNACFGEEDKTLLTIATKVLLHFFKKNHKSKRFFLYHLKAGHLNLVKVLLEKGANVAHQATEPYCKSKTPLWIASQVC